MKLLTWILLVANVAHAQITSPVFPLVNNQITYTDVVSLDSSYTAAILRNHARLFFNKAATDHNASVKLDQSKIKDFIVSDNENSVIGNVRFIAIRGIVSVLFEAVLNIEVKPGRYRYTLDNIKVLGNNLENYSAGGLLQDQYKIDKSKPMLIAFDIRIKKLIADMKLVMVSSIKQDF